MSANNNLEEFLTSLPQQQFTGIITIDAPKDRQWKIYFYLGKLLWLTSGYHPNRSWQRYMDLYFSEVNLGLLNFNARLLALHEKKDLNHIQYYYLIILLQKLKVKPEQIITLVERRTQDIFFDLLQQEHKHQLQYTKQNCLAHHLLKTGFSLTLAPINSEEILLKSRQQWLAWKTKGLASVSPNLAPKIKNSSELENVMPSLVFQNMSRLLNGKNTLRDLAIKMDKDLLEITVGIMPFFLKGYIKFKDIHDLPEPDISNLAFEAL